MNDIHIEDLNFTYSGGNNEKALNSVNLDIRGGEYVVICGRSGCSKTTLLRHLMPSVAPVGKRSGSVTLDGENIYNIDSRKICGKIGFVMQNPDSQIVTDKVWHELAFGLENLGEPADKIRLKIAETADYFGISRLFDKNVNALSGGQKQILNLASVMAADPAILLLDEPVSQLDPVASSDFLNTVGKINKEFGVTVIITEHRLEEIFPNADRIVVMDGGRIISDASPHETGRLTASELSFIRYAMPAPMRVYARVGDFSSPCPVTVRDARKWLESNLSADCPAFSGDESESESRKKNAPRYK